MHVHDFREFCFRHVNVFALAFALFTSTQTLAQSAATIRGLDGVSAEAVAQIGALLTEKESRTKSQQKIDSQLLYGARMADQREAAPGVPALEVNLSFVESTGGWLVEVDIQTNNIDGKANPNSDVVKSIAALGGSVITSVPKFNAVRAQMPLAQLEALAKMPAVRFIAPADLGEHDTGSVTSQGDRAMGADTARQTFPVFAGNVKICVLSDSASAAGIANSVANGNLSAGQVTVLPGQSGTGADEGLAMLEIINDIAPGAKLYFATANPDAATFAQNIIGLRNTYGCEIMVDDFRYGSESPFQDSVIARAVNTVTASGAIYFASAGNSGNKADGTSGTWVGDFVNGGPIGLPGIATAYEVHSFQTLPSTQNFNVVNTGGSSYALTLFWSDPEGGSTNDYDIFQLNSTGTAVVSSSTNTQNGTQNPFESTTLASTGGNRVVVVRKVGAADRALYVSTGRGRLAINTTGFARGHSASPNAIAVAAVPAAGASGAGPTGPYPGTYVSTQQTELFSSDGPARKFFNPDSSPVTPGNFLIGTGGGLVQQYPLIAAPDGVTTSVSGFAPFFGTSAAAPHAAAVAALLKAYNPTLNAAQLRTALVSTALDIKAPGLDNNSGAGIVQPVNALAAVTPAAQPGAGNAPPPSAESIAPANGAVDPDETVTLNLPVINFGGAATANVVATLQSTGGITPTGAITQTYGVIPAGGGSVARPFSFRAAGICGSTVNATLQLQDGATNYGLATYSIPLGAIQTTTSAIENFDSVTAPALPTGWISSVVSGVVVNWATSNVTPDTGINSVLAVPIASVSEVRLDSPAIAVPANATSQISFRHRWNLEDGFDGGALEIAVGAGAFADIIAAGGSFAAGGYNSTIDTGFSNPLAGRDAWSGTFVSSYTTTIVNLPPNAVGQNVRLRFRLGSDSSSLASGSNVWQIDTLTLVIARTVCASSLTAPSAPTIFNAVPGNTQAAINFAPPSSNGGAVISGYTATCLPGPIIATGLSSPIIVTSLTNNTPYTCTVTASNSAGTGGASASAAVTPSASPLFALFAVKSRKTHGGAGPFELVVDTQPANGAVTVEPRAIGSGHAIVFQFNGAVASLGSANVTPVGNVSAAVAGNEIVVTLTGVPDNQRVAITLGNVNGSVNPSPLSMGFMLGDVNNSRSINASDISGLKTKVGQSTSATNFRFDLNASGNINAADLSMVKARSGSILP